MISACFVIWSIASARAGGAPHQIETGVYTEEQAERGARLYEVNCTYCHGRDLNGSGIGPALHGEQFLTSWTYRTVNDLFRTIRESMPFQAPDTIGAAEKLEIVAYLLKMNGFPAGGTPLRADSARLDQISIAKGHSDTIPNFTLVRVTGCFARGSDQKWMLEQSSQPQTTEFEMAPQAKAKRGDGSSPRDFVYRLVGVAAYTAKMHEGTQAEIWGLIYRDAHDNRLNVTRIQAAGVRCGGS